ncbi:MAG: CRTAC1 family protein [Pirellulaceae bacterium]
MPRPTLPSSSNAPAQQSRRWLGALLGAAAAIPLCLAAWYFFQRQTPPAPRAAPRSADAALPTATPAPAAWFEDATPKSGVSFTYRNGEEADRYTLLESLGGGVGLIDYDRDGRLDIVLPGGGTFDRTGDGIHGLPTRLFRNLGGWKFAEATADVGLEQTGLYTHGCAVADYDRDGWPDLLITGYGGLALYHNVPGGNGNRRFVLATQQAGLVDPLWSTSAAWGDINGDGHPDLYVCHYADWSFANDPICKQAASPSGRDVCPPQKFQPQPDQLYLNNGDGTFRDATSEQNIRGDGYGLGVIVADLDQNAQPDIYVGNDATANFLYSNQDGRWDERGAAAGVALDDEGSYNGSMGVDAGDYDGSGRPSLWVTNFQREVHALYTNLDNGFYRHESKAAGIAALGRQFVGFGTGFLDVDNDGWLDLAIANGHVLRHPTIAPLRQRPVLMHNVSRGERRFFQDAGSRGGDYFQLPRIGRGLAIGDLDNDGWPDLVIGHSNAPIVLLRNAAAESEHHWLGVELVGKDARNVAGSTVTLQVGSRRLARFVNGGGSYLSSGDRRLLFGLGKDGQPGRLSVRWSWGETQHWDGLQPGSYYRLHETKPAAERLAPPPVVNR